MKHQSYASSTCPGGDWLATQACAQVCALNKCVPGIDLLLSGTKPGQQRHTSHAYLCCSCLLPRKLSALTIRGLLWQDSQRFELVYEYRGDPMEFDLFFPAAASCQDLVSE